MTSLFEDVYSIIKKVTIQECEESMIKVYLKYPKANDLIPEELDLSEDLINSIKSVLIKLGRKADINEMAAILYENDLCTFNKFIDLDEEEELAIRPMRFTNPGFIGKMAEIPMLTEADIRNLCRF